MSYIFFALGVLVLIAIAGFVSGSETAITGSSRAHIYHLAKKGDARAKKVIALQKNMTTTIGTILVINQIVVYLIPIVSTLFAVHHFSPATTALVQMVIAVLLMVYAEIFPKMLAIQFASRYALFIGPFLKVVVRFLRPVISLMEACAKLSLQLMGITITNSSYETQSDEELRGAIEMHSADANDEEAVQKKSMLKSILDLENVTVGHIMVHRKNLRTIDVSLSIDKISTELMHCPFSRIPAWKDNPENIVGILKVKTFFRELRVNCNRLEKIKISNIMTPPWFIPETIHLIDQLQNFQKKREHFALVVDEYGGLQGCITLEDILEEIVGEITDEEDAIVSGTRPQSDGSVIVDGSTPIRDLNREFSWNIPEEDAATIAGYIMHELRKIPDAGQVYVLLNFKIEILRRQRNQIGSVKITPLSIQASEDGLN
ncbi:MAG: CNNM domain-containing protein [Holosporaceae bacterium]|jgi:Mg2+/Co2+ transporter CorB|nr:CNNM domain-containing protein [Holosporaceae bacterium]